MTTYNADITYSVRGVEASTGKVIKLSEAVERLEKRAGPMGESARRASSGIKAMDVATASALQRLSGSNKAVDPLRMGLAALATQYVQTGAATSRAETATKSMTRTQLLATTANQALSASMLGGTLVAAGYAGSLIAMADRYTALQGKINVYATSAANAAEVEERLFDIAARARTSVEGVIGLYSRLAPAFTDLGRSQKEAARFTELVSKGLTAQGATTRETEAATVQLAQALASGVLRGDEFRSMMEASPGLMRQIAAGFEGVGGKVGVPVSALRAMAEEGELTAAKVIAAVFRMEKSIETSFSKTKPTVGQAMTVLGDQMTRAVGQQMNESGTTQAIASSLLAVAAAADKVVDAIGAVTNGMIVLGAGLAVAKVAAFVTDLTNLSRASIAAGNAINAMGVAQRVTAAQTVATASANAAFSASTITTATNLARLQQVSATTAGVFTGLNLQTASLRSGMSTLGPAIDSAAARAANAARQNIVLDGSVGAVKGSVENATRVFGGFNNGLVASTNQLALTTRAAGALTVAIPPVTANVAAMTAAKNTAANALMGFRTIAGGLVTFLGGPWSIAIMGAIFAWQKYQDATNQAAAANRGVQEVMSKFGPIVTEYDRQMTIAAGSSGKLRDAALEAANALRQQAIQMYQTQLAETRAQRARVQALQVQATAELPRPTSDLAYALSGVAGEGVVPGAAQAVGARIQLGPQQAALAAADAKLKTLAEQLRVLGLEVLNSDGQVGVIKLPPPPPRPSTGSSLTPAQQQALANRVASQGVAAQQATARAAQAQANAEEDANRKLALSLEAVDQWRTAARASADLQYRDNPGAKAQALAAIEVEANAKRTRANNQYEDSVEKAARADLAAANRDEAAAKRVEARRDRELGLLNQYRSQAEQASAASRADVEDDLTTKLATLATQRQAEIVQARLRISETGREREAIALINREYDAKELTARSAYADKVAKINRDIAEGAAAARERQLSAEASRYDGAASEAAARGDTASANGFMDDAAAWLNQWSTLTRQADNIRAQMDSDEIARINKSLNTRIEALGKELGATADFEVAKRRLKENAQAAIDLIEMQAPRSAGPARERDF
jgi:trimeric autotransporter adhesin